MLSQRQALTTPAASATFAGRLMATTAAPETRTGALPAWQAAALAAYSDEIRMSGAGPRAELAACVRALTGYAIPEGAIIVDHHARRATASVDGVTFQLRGRDLVLLRPCAHCGAALFASPPLSSQADLGYALSIWRPYHAWCEPVDPADAN